MKSGLSGLVCVPTDGVRMTDGMDGVSFELALDLRRLRPLKARLIRFAVVFDPDEASVSLPSEGLEESEELDEPSISARTPGCDSSSMTCCGVLAYMYACDLS